MALLMVPALDARPWPTLGPEICDWIEDHLVFGPGPLQGQPYVIEPEFRAEIYRMYEVFPRGHPRAGRRRFKRAALVKRKGTAKTEKAAIIGCAEFGHDAPVRCDGWRRQGSVWVPVGRPVAAPYIPMMAYTNDQAEELAYRVLRTIISESPIGDRFDIGLDRVLRLDDRGREDGKVQAVASSPSSNDGALTTWQHFDETHRLVLPRQRAAHTTMLENTFKRQDADAWSLETTTPGDLSQHSVARDSHELAMAIAEGRVEDPAMFYVHRSVPLDAPLNTRVQVRKGLVEATGPATWSADIDALCANFFAPKTDRAYFRRVWLAQWVPGGDRAFDIGRWSQLVHESITFIVPGRLITLGFDGARRRDSTALVATDVESGFQQVVGFWPRPADASEDWEVPAAQVDAVVEEAFSTWSVWRLYADPPHWDEWVDHWAGKYGSDRVVRWWTNRDRAMASALRVWRDAMTDGTVSHNGDERLALHIANAYKHELHLRVQEGDELWWTIRKERAGSPNKIDLAMAACLSWEARGDAIAAGATVPKPVKSKAFSSR